MDEDSVFPEVMLTITLILVVAWIVFEGVAAAAK